MVGRYVFYNNSAFDGRNPAANSSDDNAIATDKHALLPEQTASFVNYTNYSKGLNGIMIDIRALPGNVTSDDFIFKVGNNNNAAGWDLASNPATVALRTLAGGVTRVTVTWDDNAIQKQWLEIQVNANDDTGLVLPDVFYFGNAIAESGNSVTDAIVNATDVLEARVHPSGPFSPANVENRYDFNRDRLVNSTDIAIARDNPAGPFASLRLIQPTPHLQSAADEVTYDAMPAVLNEIVLQPIIAAAVFRWESTGFGKNVIERLNRVEFAVRDLPAGTLGTIVGNVVYLDVDAAGHGWFVDPTPSDDKEFVASQEFGLRAVDPWR